MLSNATPAAAGQTRGHGPRADATVSDYALLGCVVGVPFLLGGRLEFARLVFVGLTVLAGLAWGLSGIASRQQVVVRSAGYLVLLAAVAIAGLQLVSLPPAMIGAISPRIGKLLAVWGTGDGAVFDAWRHLSLVPAETTAALTQMVAYGLLFFVLVQRLQTLVACERAVRWIAIAAVAMAALGLLQYAAGNGKFYWFFEYPYTTPDGVVKGAFTNKNHFAQFAALGLVALLSSAATASGGRRPDRDAFGNRETSAGGASWLAGAGMAIVVTGALLSLSRGGIVAMFAGLAVTLSLLYLADVVSGRLLGGLLVSACLVGSVFLFVVADRMAERVADRLDDWTSENRWAIWKANAAAFRDFPVLGTGVGTHRDVYPMYLDLPLFDREFTHAENSYLQVASEAGAAGLAVVVLATGLLVCWCVRGFCASRSDPRRATLFAAIAGALTANLVHAAFDFVWYVPGCMVVVTVYAACACRLYQDVMSGRTTDGEPILRRASAEHTERASSARGFSHEGRAGHVADQLQARTRTWNTAACWMWLFGCGTAGVWALAVLWPRVQAEPHWLAYARLTRPERTADPQHSIEDVRRLIGVEGSAEQAERAAEDVLRQRAVELLRVVRCDPSHARARLRLAGAYVQYFDVLQRSARNPMPLDQIRDAVEASRFSSLQAMREWLSRAVGENVRLLDAALAHLKRGLELSPLSGEGYVVLAELGFLEGRDERVRRVLHQQAARVRPYSPTVHFALGVEAWRLTARLAATLSQLPTDAPDLEHRREQLERAYRSALEHWRFAFQRDRNVQRRIVRLLAPVVPAGFVIEQFGPDRRALHEVVSAYRSEGRSEQVAVALRRYAELTIAEARRSDNPRSVNDWIAAARVYETLNDRPAAMNCYRQALAAEPNSFKAHRAFGRWLLSVGEYEQATRELRWCLKYDPTDGELREMAERAFRLSHASQPEETSSVLPTGMRIPAGPSPPFR